METQQDIHEGKVENNSEVQTGVEPMIVDREVEKQESEEVKETVISTSPTEVHATSTSVHEVIQTQSLPMPTRQRMITTQGHIR